MVSIRLSIGFTPDGGEIRAQPDSNVPAAITRNKKTLLPSITPPTFKTASNDFQNRMANLPDSIWFEKKKGESREFTSGPPGRRTQLMRQPDAGNCMKGCFSCGIAHRFRPCH